VFQSNGVTSLASACASCATPRRRGRPVNTAAMSELPMTQNYEQYSAQVHASEARPLRSMFTDSLAPCDQQGNMSGADNIDNISVHSEISGNFPMEFPSYNVRAEGQFPFPSYEAHFYPPLPLPRANTSGVSLQPSPVLSPTPAAKKKKKPAAKKNKKPLGRALAGKDNALLRRRIALVRDGASRATSRHSSQSEDWAKALITACNVVPARAPESGHAAPPAATRQDRYGSRFDEEEIDYVGSEALTSLLRDSSCSLDGECQAIDTAPTTTLVSRSELAHGVTAESIDLSNDQVFSAIDLGDIAAPGGRGGGAVRGVRATRHSCSRPEQMEYSTSPRNGNREALTGAWLDNLPPSRPDGVWQLHATWLKPGEELEVEPEFDAVLARLAATPMPNPPKYHVMH